MLSPPHLGSPVHLQQMHSRLTTWSSKSTRPPRHPARRPPAAASAEPARSASPARCRAWPRAARRPASPRVSAAPSQPARAQLPGDGRPAPPRSHPHWTGSRCRVAPRVGTAFWAGAGGISGSVAHLRGEVSPWLGPCSRSTLRAGRGSVAEPSPCSCFPEAPSALSHTPSVRRLSLLALPSPPPSCPGPYPRASPSLDRAPCLLGLDIGEGTRHRLPLTGSLLPSMHTPNRQALPPVPPLRPNGTGGLGWEDVGIQGGGAVVRVLWGHRGP